MKIQTHNVLLDFAKILSERKPDEFEMMAADFQAELEIRNAPKDELVDREREAAFSGSKIRAVKLYCDRTGCGIRAGKELMDAYLKEELENARLNQEEKELASKHILGAAELFCERTGCGVWFAAQVVENFLQKAHADGIRSLRAHFQK